MNVRRNDGSFTVEGIVFSALGGCIAVLLGVLSYTLKDQIETTRSLQRSVSRLNTIIEEHSNRISENKEYLKDLNTVVYDHIARKERAR